MCFNRCRPSHHAMCHNIHYRTFAFGSLPVVDVIPLVFLMSPILMCRKPRIGSSASSLFTTCCELLHSLWNVLGYIHAYHLSLPYFHVELSGFNVVRELETTCIPPLIVCCWSFSMFLYSFCKSSHIEAKRHDVEPSALFWLVVERRSREALNLPFWDC